MSDFFVAAFSQLTYLLYDQVVVSAASSNLSQINGIFRGSLYNHGTVVIENTVKQSEKKKGR